MVFCTRSPIWTGSLILGFGGSFCDLIAIDCMHTPCMHVSRTLSRDILERRRSMTSGSINLYPRFRILRSDARLLHYLLQHLPANYFVPIALEKSKTSSHTPFRGPPIDTAYLTSRISIHISVPATTSTAM